MKKFMNKRPIRFFNTTGPCNPWDHYMLPPEERLVGAQLHRYISDNLYWVLHAPRQTGKTTFLQDWMRQINSGEEAAACYVSLGLCKGITDPKDSMPTICNAIKYWADQYNLPVPSKHTNNPLSSLSSILGNWASICATKKLVILFDEVDVLQDDTVISFLQQLRDGFMSRGPGLFPTSIALVGIKDLKDYLVAAKDGVPVNVGSAFNIKSDSASLSNFSKEDVKNLFAQRTVETGQEISGDALDYIWDQSRGQPWIVNSLFQRATMRVLKEDCYDTVTISHTQEAREQMVLARETHLDALAARLEIPEVRKVMEALITGEPNPGLLESDEYRICSDLGLVTLEDGTPCISNPIYREIIARQMTFSTQAAIQKPEWQWKTPDGSLDMDTLLKEFQKFWRKHSAVWENQSNYHEAFPHLLLMAFLQRVLNGGGEIDREYAAGRGRMDLAVHYNAKTYIIEVKLIHYYDTPTEVKKDGLKQIARYRDTIDKNAPAYLVIFDRRPESIEKSWEEKIQWLTEEDITIVGC
ncbi:hypothetical protein AGMMS49944_09380 [Spirochaetia bacterium]|nr:hypothetical protein AGMMS49944_09380 [Spirochaetia bacterium]